MKLMEAITELRAGIEENDRSRMVEGFFLLTGERLADTMDEDVVWDTEMPHPVAFKAKTGDGSKPPKVKFLEDPVPPAVVATTTPVVKPSDEFKMFNREKPENKRGQPVRASGLNRFNPAEFGDVKVEGESVDDKAKPPINRDRPPAEKYHVFCGDCEKDVEITSVEAAQVFAPGSLYKETGKYNCDLLRCGQKCPNKVK